VATLVAGVQSSAFPDGRRRVQMLAHHRHLTSGLHPDDDARIWVDGVPAPHLHAELDRFRTSPRRELNEVGAIAGGRFVASILAGRSIAASLPGIAGRAGGYPATVSLDEARLDLPVSLPDAVAAAEQQRHARNDGVTLDASEQTLTFHGRAAAALAERGVITSAAVPVADWAVLGDRLVALRASMRGAGVTERAAL
jgi:hypothetical protein